MPSLAGAITTLGLLGLSTNAPVFDSEYQASPRPYTTTFTALSLAGALPRARAVDFSGKTEQTTAAIVVTDTASLSATESPIDTQEIESTDSARLAVSESSQLFNFIAVTDTANLSLSETISLVISGVTAKTASDTASLSLTESRSIAVTVAVTDTTSLTLTESSSVVVSTEQV